MLNVNIAVYGKPKSAMQPEVTLKSRNETEYDVFRPINRNSFGFLINTMYAKRHSIVVYFKKQPVQG